MLDRLELGPAIYVLGFLTPCVNIPSTMTESKVPEFVCPRCCIEDAQMCTECSKCVDCCDCPPSIGHD